MVQDFYQEVIEVVKREPQDKHKLSRLKVSLAKKHGLKKIPSDIDILLHAKQDVLQQLDSLVSKPMRTMSGVTPVAVMTAPSNCPHGRCTYCPGGLKSVFGNVPQSYTGHEPATLRGMRNKYDGYLQVMNRLEQFVVLGHNIEKVEIIVMGGTFPATPKEYQESFITDVFRALNDFGELFLNTEGIRIEKFKEFFELPGDIHDDGRLERIHTKLLAIKKTPSSLDAEKLRNETTHVRCIGLTIETKPDWGLLKQGLTMLRQGCTRVEVGIQSVYDDVLKKVHRGHTLQETKDCLKILKDLGFKITAHYMPGLPLTDHDRDLAGMKELFDNPDFRPDQLKIYPCMISKGTGLYSELLTGKFKPLTTDEAASLIAEWKPSIPDYCRIQRVQRDVPTKYWADGVQLTNLRQYIHEKYKPVCRCIRCREPGKKNIDYTAVALHVKEYEANGGKEFFIAIEDMKNDILLGFCRLRFPGQYLREEITPETAIVRELHVYGTAIGIGETAGGQVQHRGFGKKLLAKAEKIAYENRKNKMVIIAGVGVREYYRKLGYLNDGPYVSKLIGGTA